LVRILGIDPGSRATGYGVIEEGKNGHLRFLSCGVVRTRSDSLSVRLNEIYSGLCEVISEFAPQEAAIEDVFVSVNPRAALKLGQARGVAVVASMQHNLKVFEYSPRHVKQGVVGYGQASKEQVQQMVRVLLQLSAMPSADASDALALALCHANRRRLPNI
jgi:crossover junction endodeoxyribonuclease RuvC